MTVASTLSKKQYQGNSLTTEFPLPFHVTAKEHIFALRKKGTVIEEINKNFAVDLERKVFIYPVQGEALKSDESLTVYRKIPLTQIVDLENAGAFHPEVLEYDGFDRIVMQIQQLDEEISRALKIDMTDNRDVTHLLEELFAAREEAVLSAQKALEQAKIAADKAEKTENWALYAEDKVKELNELQVECFISNDGQGHVVYNKDSHKLEIALPFDNAGLNHPRMILSDSIDLARSDIGASAKAVQSLHTKILAKIDKSAISNDLDSESEETVASSKAVKMLHDKMGKLELIEEIVPTAAKEKMTVVLTDLIVDKPIILHFGASTITSIADGYSSEVGIYKIQGTSTDIDNTRFTYRFSLGYVIQTQQAYNFSTNIMMLIPKQSTVTLEVIFANINDKLFIYQ